MYGVSASFLTALKAPSMVSSVLITASDGTTLSVQEGSVTMDSRRDITRTCELEFVPTSSMSTKQIYDLLMTPGVEVTVYRGLEHAGGTEYVPLGVFVTDSAEYSKAVSGIVSWSGSDRSKRISRAKFVDPYQVTAGMSLATAGTELLQSRWSSTQCSFTNVSKTLATDVTFEAGDSTDPWQVARQLFADYGYDLHFDGTGVCVAQEIPDPSTTAAVFDFGVGTTNLVTGGTVTGTMEDTYNTVVVSAEGTETTAPVRAVVYDDDPNSPTYYQSGFGIVPTFYSSSLLTDTAMCQRVAESMLAKLKGRTDQFTWPAIVNPALEPLDVVTVTLGGVTSRLAIDSLTVPLKASEAMSAVARLTSTA